MADWLMGALAANDQYNPEEGAYQADLLDAQQPYRGVSVDPGIRRAPGDTEMRPAAAKMASILAAVPQGVAHTIATPGAQMARNPYDRDTDTEAWQFFENKRAQTAENWGPEMALNMVGSPAVVGGVPGMGAGVRAPPKMGAVADAGTYAAPTGSKNPLANVDVTWQGKDLKDLSPTELQAMGEHYGTPNLGPLSPVQIFKDMHGNDFQLPGGTEGNWTYADLLHMKANPINPANVDRALHGEMQRKLGRTMTPEKLSDADVWNGLIFGMTSPNNPLFPNQASASRLRLRTPEMLDDLASSIPWKAGEETTTQARKLANDAIANRYGLGAGSGGGLGTRGTADYTRIAELAQMFKERPDFFRKQPGEEWSHAVERISSQVPGLSMKTGSFGTVWQDPAHAAISAIDRHMARALEETGGLFSGPQERAAWEAQSVKRWNDRTETVGKGADKVKVRVNAENQAADFQDLMAKSGSDGFIGEMLLDHVGDATTPKFRPAKLKGGINPNIGQHLAEANWVREPESVFKMGAAYKRALDLNQKMADESGLNLFMSQWMEWDRIRNRFEPHENMFPGLSNLPAPSIRQMKEVDKAHRETGHKTYGKTEEGSLQPTRPLVGPPSRMGYLGIAGAPVGAGVMGSLAAGDKYEAQ